MILGKVQEPLTGFCGGEMVLGRGGVDVDANVVAIDDVASVEA